MNAATTYRTIDTLRRRLRAAAAACDAIDAHSIRSTGLVRRELEAASLLVDALDGELDATTRELAVRLERRRP